MLQSGIMLAYFTASFMQHVFNIYDYWWPKVFFLVERYALSLLLGSTFFVGSYLGFAHFFSVRLIYVIISISLGIAGIALLSIRLPDEEQRNRY
jgi:hypothetical protein